MTGEASSDHRAVKFSHTYGSVAIAMLALIMFFNTLDRMLIAVLVEPIKADLGLSDTQFGLIIGLLFAVCYTGFGIPVARWADRGDRPLILTGCIVLWSAMTALCGAASSFWTLALVRMGVGSGEAGCAPAAHSLLADYIPPERRARAIGLMGAGGAFGVMFGMIIGGVLASKLGWRATFVVVGLPGLLVALLAWFVLREPRRKLAAVNKPAPVPFKTVITELLQNRVFLWLVAGAVLCTAGTTSITTWKTAYFMRTYNLPIEQAGVWIGLASGGASVVGFALGGFITSLARDPLHAMKIPALFVVAGGLCFLPPFLVDDWRLAVAFFVPSYVIANFWYGATFSMIQNIVDPRYRAMGAAVALFAMGVLGNGLGPTAAGFISDSLKPSMGNGGLSVAMLVMALCISAGGLCLLRSHMHLRRSQST